MTITNIRQRDSKQWRLALLVAWLLACPWGAAHAETCSVTTPAPNFGSVDPITLAAVSTTATMTVTCTWSAVTLTPNVLVCLNLGGTSPRYLTNGSNQMQYDLYQDSGHTVSWGSSYYGTTPISLTLVKPALSTSASSTVTIYGQIAANQPTVPTVGNASTTYSQTFGGNTTSLNYNFYTLAPLPCASQSSFGTFAFTASATVVNDCFINATNVAFGSTGVIQGALTATGTISAQCTNGDGAVNYQLYLDAAHSTIWGDGTAGTSTATGTGSGLSQSLTVYGQVPAQTTPAPGTYSDTITATITF